MKTARTIAAAGLALTACLVAPQAWAQAQPQSETGAQAPSEAQAPNEAPDPAATGTPARDPARTPGAAPTQAMSVEDWLDCEATAVVFKELLGVWERNGRGAAEPALSNVESLRVALSLAAVYVSVGPGVQPDDPRLAGMPEQVVAARNEASELAQRDLRDRGLDTTFAAVSQALRACGEALAALESEIRQAPPAR